MAQISIEGSTLPRPLPRPGRTRILTPTHLRHRTVMPSHTITAKNTPIINRTVMNTLTRTIIHTSTRSRLLRRTHM